MNTPGYLNAALAAQRHRDLVAHAAAARLARDARAARRQRRETMAGSLSSLTAPRPAQPIAEAAQEAAHGRLAYRLPRALRRTKPIRYRSPRSVRAAPVESCNTLLVRSDAD